MGPAYPRNQREFDALVASEEACPRYLSQIRWPEGFVCPACGHRRRLGRIRLVRVDYTRDEM